MFIRNQSSSASSCCQDELDHVDLLIVVHECHLKDDVSLWGKVLPLVTPLLATSGLLYAYNYYVNSTTAVLVCTSQEQLPVMRGSVEMLGMAQLPRQLYTASGLDHIQLLRSHLGDVILFVNLCITLKCYLRLNAPFLLEHVLLYAVEHL